jgi:hypothetical protein
VTANGVLYTLLEQELKPAVDSAVEIAASAAAPPQPRRGVHVWVATVARQSEPASERLHAAARALTATHAPLRHVPGDAVVSIAPAHQAPVQHGLVAPAEHTSADRRERGHWSFHPVGRRVQFIYDYLRRHAVSAAAQDAGATGLVPGARARAGAGAGARVVRSSGATKAFSGARPGRTLAPSDTRLCGASAGHSFFSTAWPPCCSCCARHAAVDEAHRR